MADLLTYGPVVSEMHCQCYPVIRHSFSPLGEQGKREKCPILNIYFY